MLGRASGLPNTASPWHKETARGWLRRPRRQGRPWQIGMGGAMGRAGWAVSAPRVLER